MRKPRDYDAELKALESKARQLKARRQNQLGELVIACNADALDAEELAGALLDAVGTTDAARKEAWRKRGAGFFSGERQTAGRSPGREPAGTASQPGSTPSSGSEPGAT